MVQRYEEKPLLPSRSDEEIWHEFRKQLEAKHVLVHLRPKRIVAKDYDYQFEHARKNEIWHAYEPVSFDLMDADTILDKRRCRVKRSSSRSTERKNSPRSWRMKSRIMLATIPKATAKIGRNARNRNTRLLAAEIK